MELTDRQSKILNLLIKEYIDSAEPVSSDLLKRKTKLDISPATIRNDLQELTEKGYVAQPHTSAGRVPTDKAYRYFIETVFFEGNISGNLISREIEIARLKIEKELQMAQELTKSLTEISTTLSYTRLENKDNIFEVLKIIGPSRTTYDKNIDVMRRLVEEFDSFF